MRPIDLSPEWVFLILLGVHHSHKIQNKMYYDLKELLDFNIQEIEKGDEQAERVE